MQSAAPGGVRYNCCFHDEPLCAAGAVRGSFRRFARFVLVVLTVRGLQKMSVAISVARRNQLLAASKDVRGATVCRTDCLSDDLVAACQRGEREAQRQLYEEHQGRIYSLMVRMVGTEDAADLTQQVFLQVLRTIRQFSGRSQLSTWIYRLAVNEALQHLRKKGKAKVHPLDYDAVDGSPAGTRQTEEAELLEQALARLDPELRSIFLLREVDGLPYQEIAASLDIPEGTVGSRLNRARQQLRIHLVDLGWQP